MCQWPVGEPGGDTRTSGDERVRRVLTARLGDDGDDDDGGGDDGVVKWIGKGDGECRVGQESADARTHTLSQSSDVACVFLGPDRVTTFAQDVALGRTSGVEGGRRATGSEKGREERARTRLGTS